MDVIDLQQINIIVFVTEDSPISYQNFIKVFNKSMEVADHDDSLNYEGVADDEEKNHNTLGNSSDLFRAAPCRDPRAA